jgi:hypothetical protein
VGLHANFTTLTAETPAVLPAGSTLRTTCTWNNPNSTTVGFPDEMCTFVGYYVGSSDVNCIDGAMIFRQP